MTGPRPAARKRPRPRIQRRGVAGRPPFKPTAKQRADVLLCTGLGMAQHAMCELIGVSINTLRQYFEGELRQGTAVLEHKNGRTIVELLQDKNPFVRLQTATLLAKSRFGWLNERNVNLNVDANAADLRAAILGFDQAPVRAPVALLPAPLRVSESHRVEPTGSYPERNAPPPERVIEGESERVEDDPVPRAKRGNRFGGNL